MSKKTYLDQDDLAILGGMLAEALHGGTEPGRTSLAEAVWPALMRSAESGGADAQRIIEALARDGLSERTYVFLKSETGYLALPGGGRIAAAARVSVRKRRADGRRDRSQLRFWWDLTWAEYAEWRDQMQALEARIAAKRHAFAQVDRLRETYPDTATPAEACERAGIDPMSFGLDAAA